MEIYCSTVCSWRVDTQAAAAASVVALGAASNNKRRRMDWSSSSTKHWISAWTVASTRRLRRRPNRILRATTSTTLLITRRCPSSHPHQARRISPPRHRWSVWAVNPRQLRRAKSSRSSRRIPSHKAPPPPPPQRTCQAKVSSQMPNQFSRTKGKRYLPKRRKRKLDLHSESNKHTQTHPDEKSHSLSLHHERITKERRDKQPSKHSLG